MDRLDATVSATEADWIAGMLWGAGIAGIEETDTGDGSVRFLISVEPARVDAARAVLGDRPDVAHSTLPDDDGAWDAWRPHARAVRIAETLVIQPPWVDAIARPTDTVVSLDPQRAWGHGAHPTSVLAAQVLVEAAPLEGLTVLDVGCGSGVLALAAVASGAESVVAIDVDPEAVSATLANAAVNGMDGGVVASTTPIARVQGSFDWVVANIGAETIRSMSAHLADALAPDGTMVLSGLLDEQADGVVAAFPGFVEVRRLRGDGWAVPVLRRG